MNAEMPNKPGYYWAKWRIASDETPEGDELTPCDDWEIVQINDNGGKAGTLEEFSVSVAGVGPTQWRDCFVWGSFVAPLKAPALTSPDLLAALKAILANHETVGAGASIFQCTTAEVNAAREAISKAEAAS